MMPSRDRNQQLSCAVGNERPDAFPERSVRIRGHWEPAFLPLFPHDIAGKMVCLHRAFLSHDEPGLFLTREMDNGLFFLLFSTSWEKLVHLNVAARAATGPLPLQCWKWPLDLAGPRKNSSPWCYRNYTPLRWSGGSDRSPFRPCSQTGVCIKMNEWEY